MSDLFKNRKNFQGEFFYYFLPNINTNDKNKIGEKICEFKGVNNSFIDNILQALCISTRTNMTILIEKEQDVNSLRFKEEILTKGEVKFYTNNKIEIIKFVNKNITPEKYNCILLVGKNIIYL